MMANGTTPEILQKDKFVEVFYNFLSWIKRYTRVYDIRRKLYFKSKCIEGASKACIGKPRIYYFVEDIGKNKLRVKFEAN